MEAIFDHLAVWLAPVLCFTAEEAWLARHPSENDSVHFQLFPETPAAWHDEGLGKKWAAIRDVRRVVTGAMEVARAEKKIGSSLQAAPELYVTEAQATLLGGLDFAEICIASDLEIKTAEPPADAFTLPDVPLIGAIVKLAQGEKCERCWQVRHDVDENGLCPRCAQALAKA